MVRMVEVTEVGMGVRMMVLLYTLLLG